MVKKYIHNDHKYDFPCGERICYMFIYENDHKESLNFGNQFSIDEISMVSGVVTF